MWSISVAHVVEVESRREEKDAREPLWEMSAAAAEFFTRALWNEEASAPAREYLAARTLSPGQSPSDRLANAARVEAEAGGNIVGQAIAAMSDINTSSKKITNIIGVIDKISFQTNLLALNASVEAARAGEQGRGFAVVASEVRSLAQRSAQAAKEIKSLISASVESVASGSKLVQEAGTTMGDIVASVQRVTDIIGEITAATQEQSQGLGQVSGAVTDLDQMTQQNAALVEESSAAAESLREQAARLSEAVGTFRLGA